MLHLLDGAWSLYCIFDIFYIQLVISARMDPVECKLNEMDAAERAPNETNSSRTFHTMLSQH
jgi:hypothetical protein